MHARPTEARRTAGPTKTVLAISSPGGHWMQLTQICRQLPQTVIYARAAARRPDDPARCDGSAERAHWLPDANKDRPLALMQCLNHVARLVWRTRPDLVITTGAAPGCFACVLASLTGRRAIFIDSIANAERLSLSARLCAALGVEVVTQWPGLQDGKGVTYRGSVLGELQ
jgi:hypothetical protein